MAKRVASTVEVDSTEAVAAGNQYLWLNSFITRLRVDQQI